MLRKMLMADMREGNTGRIEMQARIPIENTKRSGFLNEMFIGQVDVPGTTKLDGILTNSPNLLG